VSVLSVAIGFEHLLCRHVGMDDVCVCIGVLRVELARVGGEGGKQIRADETVVWRMFADEHREGS